MISQHRSRTKKVAMVMITVAQGNSQVVCALWDGFDEWGGDFCKVSYEIRDRHRLQD